MSLLKRSMLPARSFALALAALAVAQPARGEDDLVTTQSAGLGKEMNVDGRSADTGSGLDVDFRSHAGFTRRGLGIDVDGADALRAPTLDPTRAQTVEVMRSEVKPPSDLDILKSARTDLIGPAMDWLAKRPKAQAGAAKVRKGKGAKLTVQVVAAPQPPPASTVQLPRIAETALADLGYQPLTEHTAEALAGHGVNADYVRFYAGPGGVLAIGIEPGNAPNVRQQIAALQQVGPVDDGTMTVSAGMVGGQPAFTVSTTTDDGTPMRVAAIPLGTGLQLTLALAGPGAADEAHYERLAAAVVVPEWLGTATDAEIRGGLVEATPWVPLASLDLDRIPEFHLHPRPRDGAVISYRGEPGPAGMSFEGFVFAAVNPAYDLGYLLRNAQDRAFDGNVRTSRGTLGGAPALVLDYRARNTRGADQPPVALREYVVPLSDGRVQVLVLSSGQAIDPAVADKIAGAFTVTFEHEAALKLPAASGAAPGADVALSGGFGEEAPANGFSGGEGEEEAPVERGPTPLPAGADNLYALGYSTGGLHLGVARDVGEGVASVHIDAGSIVNVGDNKDSSGFSLGLHYGAITPATEKSRGEFSLGLHLAYASIPGEEVPCPAGQSCGLQGGASAFGVGFGYRAAYIYEVLPRVGLYGELKGQFFPQESLTGSALAVGIGLQYDGRP